MDGLVVASPYEVLPREELYRPVRVPDPAAGQDLQVSVPGGARWRLLSVMIRYVASAAVATRTPNLVVTDGTDEVFRVPSPGQLTAGQTFNWVWFVGAVAGGFVGVNQVAGRPLPETVLLPGWTVGTLTDLIQVGDQISRPVVYVAELVTRGPRASVEYIRQVLREMLRQTGLEELGDEDPLAALVARMFGAEEEEVGV